MPPNFFDKLIIADTSCLIALTNIGSLDVLRQVCQTVFITPEIAGEYGEDLPPGLRLSRFGTAKRPGLSKKSWTPVNQAPLL
jgi:hypothetical protein